MSTHNIGFRGEIRKFQYFWIEKSALTRAMGNTNACIPTIVHNILS